MIQAEQKDERYSTAIDLIKCIACLGVVSIHFSMFYNTMYEDYIRVLDSISVPSFMSVSGYLLFFRKKRTYREVLQNNFMRYFSVFLFWSLIHIIYSYVMYTPEESFIHYAAQNSEGWHMWYLKVYLQIIFCYPFIIIIAEKRKLYIFYSILWIIFISIRYSFAIWFSIDSVYLKVIQLPFFQYSGLISGTIKGYYPMEALGIFILGGATINHFEERKLSEIKKIWMYFMGVFAGIVICIITCYVTTMFDRRMYAYICDPYMINVMVMMLSFIIFIYLVEDKFNNKMKIILHWLADKTLGIYILQSFMNKGIIFILNYSGMTNQYFRKIIVFFGILIGGGIIYSYYTKNFAKEVM